VSGDYFYDPEFKEDRPTETCSECDEPTWRVYSCASCGVALCPGCVCLDLDDGDRDLCPSCPGAGLPFFPEPVARVEILRPEVLN